MLKHIRSHKVFGIPFVDILFYVALFMLLLIIIVPDNYSNVYFNQFVNAVASYIPMIENLANKTYFSSVAKITLSFVWIAGACFAMLYFFNYFFKLNISKQKCKFSSQQIASLIAAPFMTILLLYLFKETGDKPINEYARFGGLFLRSLTGSKSGLFFNSYFLFYLVFSLVFLLNISLSIIFNCIYRYIKGEVYHGRN